MANTVAGLQAIIDAIDTRILTLISGGVPASLTIGSQTHTEFSLDSLRAMRKELVEQRDALNADAGEYVDHQHQGIDKCGTDGTAYVGDDEE